MRSGKELSGKPIFSITDGRKVGVVKDVFISDDLSRLIGLNLGHKGLFKRKLLAIKREDVVILGVDTVLVKDADVVFDDKEMEEIKEWIRLGKLKGREVDTPGGTRVGTIGDITVDEEGEIVGFKLGRVFVEGPIAEQKFISRDVVIKIGSGNQAMTIDLTKAEGTPEESSESIEWPQEVEQPAAETQPEPEASLEEVALSELEEPILSAPVELSEEIELPEQSDPVEEELLLEQSDLPEEVGQPEQEDQLEDSL